MSIAPSTLDAEIETFGEPAWDVARLFPEQGHWTEGDYFCPRGGHEPFWMEFSQRRDQGSARCRSMSSSADSDQR